MCPDWRLLAWKAGGRPIGAESLCDWLGGHVWLSLIGPSWKLGQKLEKLAVAKQVLAIWGILLQQLFFSYLDCH